MWRRQWQPPPVPLPGKSRGWRSLIYYSPWGRKEPDTTERLQGLQHIEWAHFNLITSLKTLSLDKATFWGTENSSHNTVHHSLAPQPLLLLFSCPAVSNSLWPHRLQHGWPSLSHHLLEEFALVHVHCIGDAVQPSHPLMPSSPSVLTLSQHQGLFEWIICEHQMTKILELQLQHQSFQWIFRVDLP